MLFVSEGHSDLSLALRHPGQMARAGSQAGTVRAGEFSAAWSASVGALAHVQCACTRLSHPPLSAQRERQSSALQESRMALRFSCKTLAALEKPS